MVDFSCQSPEHCNPFYQFGTGKVTEDYHDRPSWLGREPVSWQWRKQGADGHEGWTGVVPDPYRPDVHRVLYHRY